ncbi:hypothetical protein [Thiothrix nivea]|uniref:Secreted protein n=1 Tax=Thiothrix nivea (strain ATCC 35100 / DSM 5205 / JP2) TaxID=870187 RepID=A0A656HGH4_THINJ|nr:hypothetical protein [Thiothrix nivea]EIJ35503.1 hypothetical protein Thini_2977 [Thiothrix nivea DSM 5205]
MKTLFATMMLASAVIAFPVFAEDTAVSEVLAGNAAELSSSEMETTEGAGSVLVLSGASNSVLNVAGAGSFVGSSQVAGATGTGVALGPFGTTIVGVGSSNTGINAAVLGSGVFSSQGAFASGSGFSF